MENHEIIYSGEHPLYPHVWEIHRQAPNGSKWLVLIPKDALNWRSAEYGVDPTDVDTLIDMLVHEFHIPTPQQEQLDPELKAKALPRLWETDNEHDARDHHLKRIRQASIQMKVKGNKALDPIRQGHVPDHEGIKQKRQRVDIVRYENKYGELPIPKEPVRQVEATPLTGMKGNSKDSSPDSMMIVGSNTISAKGS